MARGIFDFGFSISDFQLVLGHGRIENRESKIENY